VRPRDAAAMLTISGKSVIKLHPLERQVLDRLLASTDRELSTSDLKLLKIQLRNAMILSREMTGHSFYTRFLVAERALRLPNHHSLWFGWVYADVPGLKHGAGFQLYIKGGAVDELEGYSFGDEPSPDPWPGQFDEFGAYEVRAIPPSEKLETKS
jgi:hypothetical protein